MNWGHALSLGMAMISGFLCVVAEADAPNTSIPPITAPATSTSSPENEGKTLPQVTIEAQRQDVERRAHAFVRALTHSERFYGESLALWRAPLCFAVAGLPKTQGEFILARLSDIAASAGARLDKQNCTPNYIVLLTPTPNRLLESLSARTPRLFGSGQPGQIRRFLNPSKSRAVRVWHNASAVDKNGEPLRGLGAACGGLPVSWMSNDVPTNCEQVGSHLTYDSLIAFFSVIIVVDTTLTKDATFEQLAGYVAMIGLADIDPDDNFGDAPSILRLFASPMEVAPAGLTSWDRTFLHALYHTDQGSRTQRSQIVVSVIHDVSP